jgi:cytochrome P450
MAIDTLLTEVASYRSGFPHEVFERLRNEGAVHYQPPVQFRQDEPATDFWSVVRHAEVQRANRDWETFSSNDSVSIYKLPAQAGTTIVSMDPPQHTRVRRLISAGFTPRMIKRLIDVIGVRTKLILDEAASMAECDFVRDIAYQLPMHVIADIVGIPEPDRRWVFERTELILRSLDPNSALTMKDHNRNQLELFTYAQELTERKRRDPSDDVWTLIAQAEIPSEDGTTQRLQGIELELFFAVLAVAGTETTRNAMSIGLLTLLENAHQLSELREQPELIDGATDEIIRWASPVMFFARTATCDTELGGERIRSGDRVVLWYPSANRDEREFEEPFRFDIHRSPNRHVSFGGGGPHYCLGANLARKEIEIMMSALLSRFDIDLAGDVAWFGAGPVHNVGVSIDRMPVKLTERSA